MGLGEDASVANEVETEQIITYDGLTFSFVIY